MFVFICCPDMMRKSPQNYIILMLFATFKAVLVGFICLQYTTSSVLVALGMTAFLVLSLSLFAWQTSYDFTGCGPYLFCGALCLMGLGFAFMVGSWLGLAASPAFQTLHLIYAACGAMLFS